MCPECESADCYRVCLPKVAPSLAGHLIGLKVELHMLAERVVPEGETIYACAKSCGFLAVDPKVYMEHIGECLTVQQWVRTIAKLLMRHE